MSGPSLPIRLTAAATSYPTTDTVTSPDGDSLTVGSVTAARFPNGFCWVYETYNPGDQYEPCAGVSFTDSVSGSQVVNNNYETDAEYDACGNLVGGGTTYGWYYGGDYPYLLSGFATGSLIETIPDSLDPACAGTFTIVYSFTQTFTDGDTLTATAESLAGVFTVNPVQSLSWSETAGGGSGSEVFCQVCAGDPVDTATGDYSESATDLSIGGRGPGLQLTRTYSSLEAEAGMSSPVGAGWSFNYGMSLSTDAQAGTATVTESSGSQTVFTLSGSTYTAPPRVLASLVSNSDGTWTYTVRARTVYTFSSAGQLAGIADLNGNKITLAYNTSGQLQTATGPGGRTFTFAYDPSGWLASVTDSSGRQVAYTHDSAGDLTSVTDVRGGQWTYAYDSVHLLLTRQDANGNVVMTNTYDANGRTLTQTGALGNETTFSYNADPSTETTVTDPNGNVTEDYYENGFVTKTVKVVSASVSDTWTYTHDEGHSLAVTSVTNPGGYTTKYTYDANGNQTSSTDPLGHTTSSAYDALNDMTSHTDGNGVTTTYTYDSYGNLLSSSTPVGSQSQTSSYAYDSYGDLTSVTNPDGNTTTFTYDVAGNRISATDPAGDKTTYGYDSISRQTSLTSPRGNVTGANPAQFTTTYTYDAAGDMLTSTDPLGHTTTWAYDGDGNKTSVTDPDGNTTSYTYDAANRLTTVSRPDGTTLHNGYDADANLTSQTDGAGNTTSYTYDALNHLSSATDPLNRTTTYSYGWAGNLLSATDPKGRTTTDSYNVGSELTSVTYSDGVTPNVSYAYDADGRRTSMTDGSGATSYTYDALGHLTQMTDGQGNTTSFTYDLAGNQTSLTYPNGKTVTRTFDAAGRTATVTDWLKKKTTYAYDPDSDLTSISTAKTTDTYTYDHAGQAAGVTMAAGRSTLATIAYTRDPNGQIASETTTGLPASGQSYSYNTLNQLTQAGASSYAYDTADNPTTIAGSSGYSYDAGNQLTQSPTATYTYNSLGERTALTPVSGAATTYTYDQAGRLTSATTGTNTATYAYNGDGLRISKNTGGSTAVFVWDASSVVPLLLTDGANSYVYNPDGTPLEQISSSGTLTYYHRDQLGSIRLLTSSTGTSVGTFTYNPYGTLADSTGTTTTPFGYAGQYTDAETGFIYLRARYYDPQTGQFITRDPLLTLTRTAYIYVTDNPLNGTDPTGMCGFWCWTGIGAAVVGTVVCIIAEPCGLAEGGALAIAGGGTLATAITFTGADVLAGGAAAGGLLGATGYALASGNPGNGGTCPEAADPAENPNLSSLKKVSDSRLKNIVGDVHQFKSEIVGGNVSRFNVYVDKDSGYLFLIDNSGGDPIPTYVNINDGP